MELKKIVLAVCLCFQLTEQSCDSNDDKYPGYCDAMTVWKLIEQKIALIIKTLKNSWQRS